jgi:hypothetical protein
MFLWGFDGSFMELIVIDIQWRKGIVVRSLNSWRHAAVNGNLEVQLHDRHPDAPAHLFVESRYPGILARISVVP